MWQNMASRNLGSNQVLFGGMMPPASAMVIKSATLVGNREKAQANSPLLTSFSNSSVPRMPPTKLTRSAGARIVNAEDRGQDVLLQQSHVQSFHRVCHGAKFRTETQRAPAVFQEQRQFMFAAGPRRAAVRDHENRFQFFQQLRGAQAVQIFQHAIVRQDAQLIVRKNHAQKKSASARAPARLEDPRRRRAAMMSVGDVKERNVRERAAQQRNVFPVAQRPRANAGCRRAR